MKYSFNNKEHLHLLDGKPLTGTTTILDVMGKNLVWWSAELAAIECLESGIKIPTIRKEYLSACESGEKKKYIDALQVKYPAFKKARFAHFNSKNKKAEEGNNLHSELEFIVKETIRVRRGKPFIGQSIPDNEVEKKIYGFGQWAFTNVKRFIGSEVYVYDEDLWLGGIIDCIAEMKDDSIAIIDFKSAKEVYFNHFVQTALYAIQLAKNGAFDENGNRLLDPIEAKKYIVVPFGAKEIKPNITNNIKELQRAGKATVELYRAKLAFEQ